MNHQIKEDSIDETLLRFESLSIMQPTANWESELIKKMAAAKPAHKSDGLPTFKLAMGVLFFVLINTAFILRTLNGNSINKGTEHNDALHIISNELLIAPITSNN